VTKIIAGLYFFFFSLSFGRYHMMIKQTMHPINIRGDAARSVQMVRFRFRSKAKPPSMAPTVIFARLLSALKGQVHDTPRARWV
jgi:hypothetical protein